jgi:hypothetical protein
VSVRVGPGTHPKQGIPHQACVPDHSGTPAEAGPSLPSLTEPPNLGENAAEDELPCLRCETPLVFVADREFREGSGGLEFAFGRLGALFGSSTRLEIWACPSCGQVEFFLPGVGE